MAQILVDLNNYVVTDSGEVAVHWSRLFDHIKAGGSLDGLKALPSEHVEVYNRRRGKDREIPIAEFNDEVTGPSIETYRWQMPKDYWVMDLATWLAVRLNHRGLSDNPIYIDRLNDELKLMEERGMLDLLRVLFHIVDVFERNGVVHGIGRGSACASLVLYLIGIHMVDPVLYEIPITEFLR